MALGRKGLVGAALLLIGAFAVTATDASANSRLCRQLEAQLASGGGGGGSAQFKKYDRAVNAQRDQLSKARSSARRAGCTFSLFGGKEQCSSLNKQIERMERNLDALERKRTELSGGGTSKRERARILASIEANGCRDGNARRIPQEVAARDGGSLFDRLFGGGLRSGTYENETLGRSYEDDGTGHYGMSGRFRTLCVRTCDGYYFPMSGGSSGRDFARDQQNCEAMCPGTEIQLYYHDATGEESEQMISVATGEPYTALSTAYQYRQLDIASPAGCGCNPAKNFNVLGDGAEAAVQSEPAIPMPTTRLDPAANPETLANAEGALDRETIARILKPKPTASITPPADPAERKVRVVGPVFLPDQAEAIDLRAPARKTVQ